MKHILHTYDMEKTLPRFPTNSKVNASEFLENLEEMFPGYW